MPGILIDLHSQLQNHERRYGSLSDAGDSIGDGSAHERAGETISGDLWMWAWGLSIGLSVGLLLALAVMFAILLFNRPKALVPPHLRDGYAGLVGSLFGPSKNHGPVR